MKYCLRKLENMADVPIQDLPIVFTGTKKECEQYATSVGAKWRSKPNTLFGGQWNHPDFELLPDSCPQEFKSGDKIHLDTDHDEWGRVASDGEVIEVVTRKLLLVEVFSIRANILVPIEDVHLT